MEWKTWKWTWFGCIKPCSLDLLLIACDYYSRSHLNHLNVAASSPSSSFCLWFYVWFLRSNSVLITSHLISLCTWLRCRRKRSTVMFKLKTFYLLLNCTEKLSKCFLMSFRREQIHCIARMCDVFQCFFIKPVEKIAAETKNSQPMKRITCTHIHTGIGSQPVDGLFSATCSNCSRYHYDSFFSLFLCLFFPIVTAVVRIQNCVMAKFESVILFDVITRWL